MVIITDALWKLLNPFWQLRFGPSISAMSRDRGPWNFDPAQFGMLMISGMSAGPGYVFIIFSRYNLHVGNTHNIHIPYPRSWCPFDLQLKCFMLFPKILEHLGAFLKPLPSMSGFQSVDVSGDSHWATKLSKFKATGMELEEVWLTLAWEAQIHFVHVQIFSYDSYVIMCSLHQVLWTSLNWTELVGGSGRNWYLLPLPTFLFGAQPCSAKALVLRAEVRLCYMGPSGAHVNNSWNEHGAESTEGKR